MVTQNRQPQKGINPGNKGPAQPQDVEDPHPADAEGYDEGHRTGNGDKDHVKGGKRPSDTSGDRQRQAAPEPPWRVPR